MRSLLRRRRVRAVLGAAAAAAVFFGALPGCYLIRLGCGQCSVAMGQRPLDDVIADPATPEPARRALRLVVEIRRFGVESLGMEAGDSYTTYYDTGGGPVLYNVTASRADRLEAVTWWFPVTGSVAYKGYFAREDARREREYLERIGYDALLSPVSAYSTLGWFRDPVLSTMLDDPPEALAELLLHEMTHATVYAPGDTEFNERLASFVGGAAAEAFFTAREGAEGPTVLRQRARRADERRFGAWLRETREALEAFYAGPGTAEEKRRGRASVFEAARARFQALQPCFETDTYDGFGRIALNNAVILACGRYNEAESPFARVADRLGGDLRELLRRAAAWAATADPAREAERFAGGAGDGM
jgi:predicted aminopeptidase